MRFLFVCSLFFLCTLSVSAQSRVITCTTQRNADNSLSIWADNNGYGEYTVKLMFTAYDGYNPNISIYNNVALVNVRRGHFEIARFTLQKTALLISFSYRYNFWPGPALHKSPDTSFTYLLPGTEGSSLRVSRVNYMGSLIGKTSSDNFSGVSFTYKNGDTICAARAGLVYAATDEVTSAEKQGEVFKRERNNIHILHKDGTIAQYTITAPIKLLIQEGDEVVPGQPLAVFNTPADKYTVLFSIYYTNEKKALVNTLQSEQQSSPHSYVSSLFYLNETLKHERPELNRVYTIERSKEVIGAELSKKEKKKLGL